MALQLSNGLVHLLQALLLIARVLDEEKMAEHVENAFVSASLVQSKIMKLKEMDCGWVEVNEAVLVIMDYLIDEIRNQIKPALQTIRTGGNT